MNNSILTLPYDIKSYLKNERFLYCFSKEEELLGFELYRKKEFSIIKDNSEELTIKFKDNEVLDFSFSKRTFSCTSNNAKLKDEQFICGILYMYYKISESNDILELYTYVSNCREQYISFFPLLLKTYGYYEKILNSYSFDELKRYIILLPDINVNLLTTYQRDMYYKIMLDFSIKLDDDDYQNLTITTLNIYIHGENQKALYYIGEIIFKNTDRMRAYQFFNLIEKKARFSNSSSIKKMFISYLKSRLLYEYLDTNEGLKVIEKEYYSNPYIKEYYSRVLEANGEEISENIFINKNTYDSDDLELVKKYINNWDYEFKEKVLSTICHQSDNGTTIKEVLSLLNESELKKFVCNNFEVISMYRKICDNIIEKFSNDLDFILDFAKKVDINILLKKWDSINYPENEIKIFECFLDICMLDVTNRISRMIYADDKIFELIAKIEKFTNGRVMAYFLIGTISRSNYGLDSRKKRILRELIEIDNKDFNLFKKRINCNNICNIVRELELEKEYGSIANVFEKKFSLTISQTINPRVITGSVYSNKIGTILDFAISDEEIFKYITFWGEDTEILKVILLMVSRYFTRIGEDSIEKIFLELEDEEKIRYENELKKKAKKELRELLEIAKRDEVAKTYDEVHLVPYILVLNQYNEQVKLLSFKIGINKLYIVKNYEAFINNINSKSFYEYGKGFSFNHNIDSFDDKSKALLEMLLGDNRVHSAYYYGDNRYVAISNKNFDEIVFENDAINLNKGGLADLKLKKMDPIELEIYIDENYNVYCQSKIDKMRLKGGLIKGFEYDYYTTEDKIYPIKTKKELRQIYAKLICREMNISLIKKDFISEIYARFMDDFVIDESIKSEFNLKDLNIETYFDYENGVISYHDKFSANGKEIKIEKINNQVQMFKKYNKYKSILDNFGFNENVIDTNDKIYNFLRADLSFLKELTTVYLSENIKETKIKEYSKSNVYIGYNTGLLDVCFEESEFSEEDLYKIISSLRKKIKYVKLSDNTIVKVGEKEATELLNIVDELKLDPHHLKTKQKVPLYQSLKLASDLDYSSIKVSKNIRDMIDEISDYKNANFIIPEKFSSVMRDYQKDAYKWIKILSKYSFSGILADDMGLGKSLEIISVIASDDKNMPSLIVCPKSLVYNWSSEFGKWASDIEVYPVIGLSNERHKIMKNYDANKKQAFLISYDSLKNELELFNKFNFRYLILDEAQFIKNHTTLKAQSVKKINSELRFVLTGTPIENSVIDLWSIFDFLMPNYLYNYSEFKASYEKRIVDKDEEATRKLVMKITPFILRRTKQDVLKDLPEKIETFRIVQMNDIQKKYYDAQLLKTKLLLEAQELEKKKNNIEVLASLTRLRQICVDPSMFIEGYSDMSCKDEAVCEIIDEYIAEHKIIIFSQFTKAFINLEKILQEKDISFAKITGDTTAFERITIANDFNDTNKYKVILVSLKAGGTGLNLVGADIVVHLDPWWNVAAENQASDRAHRIGQKSVVQVIKIICKDSIEQKVIELQNIKKDIVNSLITNDDSAILKLTSDDMKYLLK